MTKDEVHGILMKVPGMTEEMAGLVHDAGFVDKDALYEASVSALEAVEGVDYAMANNIQSIVRRGVLVGDVKEEEKTEESGEEAGSEASSDGGVMGMVNGIFESVMGTIKGLAAKKEEGPEGEGSAPETPATDAPPAPEPPAPGEPPSGAVSEPLPPPPGAEEPAAAPSDPPPEPEAPEPAPVAPEPAAEPASETAPEPGPEPVPEAMAPTSAPPASLDDIVVALRDHFDITTSEAQALAIAGFSGIDKVKAADLISLAEIDGITLTTAKSILSK